jgi:hypothetical protein
MKRFINYTMIMLLGTFIAFNAAVAAERVKIVELAESGQTIEFYQVTPRMATELPETEIAKGNPEDSRASVR